MRGHDDLTITERLVAACRAVLEANADVLDRQQTRFCVRLELKMDLANGNGSIKVLMAPQTEHDVRLAGR